MCSLHTAAMSLTLCTWRGAFSGPLLVIPVVTWCVGFIEKAHKVLSTASCGASESPLCPCVRGLHQLSVSLPHVYLEPDTDAWLARHRKPQSSNKLNESHELAVHLTIFVVSMRVGMKVLFQSVYSGRN